jgi:UDP-N-acetylglucosamine--N-acetylmuramyl-(pentapeptide) pyrophosphoryl-undecaprenol N-acetylglucosamine transferase
MTCAELAAVGLPAIYVPLPIGNGEQRLNALPVVQAGGGVLVPDAELTADRVVSEVVSTITDAAGLHAAGQAARQHGATDGARLLVDMVLQAAAGGVDRTEPSSGGMS